MGDDMRNRSTLLAGTQRPYLIPAVRTRKTDFE